MPPPPRKRADHRGLPDSQRHDALEDPEQLAGLRRRDSNANLDSRSEASRRRRPGRRGGTRGPGIWSVRTAAGPVSGEQHYVQFRRPGWLQVIGTVTPDARRIDIRRILRYFIHGHASCLRYNHPAPAVT